MDHIPGTTNTIQPLKTPKNAETLCPVNQRTNPERAKDPPIAKPQTPQPETKRQVETGARFTQRPQRHRQLQLKPHSNSTALQMNPSEMRMSLAGQRYHAPHLSAESPDKMSKCCDKLNETGSPNESPLAKTTPDNPRTPPRRSGEKRPPVRLGDYIQF